MVKCQRCQRQIPEGESFEYLGQTLCDDCYMDARSPAKPCDPWAVYTATRTRQSSGLTGVEGLTPQQREFYEFVKARGKVTPAELMKALNVSQQELDGLVATLRHCELVRGQKEGDKVYLVPF